MTDWLSLAISDAVPIAPLAPIAPSDAAIPRPIGPNGTIGQAARDGERAPREPNGAIGAIGTEQEDRERKPAAERSVGPIGAIGTNGIRQQMAAEARAHIEVTANRLEADGVHQTEAIVRAVAIVRADLHGDARLVTAATDTTRCAVCSHGDREADPLLPILSPDALRPHWVHGGRCHSMLRRRIVDRVADVMDHATSLRLVEAHP